jgi:hypothetical protein
MGECRNRVRIRRWTAVLAAFTFHLTVLLSGQAHAQGLFETLFGARQAPNPPSQALSYSRPDTAVTQPAIRSSIRSGRYCVRLCDGRFFPIEDHSTAGAAQLCNALCPASQTKIFSGSGIEHATAADGTRYTSLQNAFVYRARLVADCTCNGRNHFGLAPIDPNSDPDRARGNAVKLAKDAR